MWFAPVPAGPGRDAQADHTPAGPRRRRMRTVFPRGWYRSASMDSTLGFVASGAAYGLAAGFAPGPLLALVLAESVRRGTAGGVQVAFAPLLTDPVIVLLALLAYTRIAEPGPLVGVVALAGAAVLLSLAAGMLAPQPPPPQAGPRPAAAAHRFGPLARGLAANLSNPHPYLFWLTVGAPTLAQARASGGTAAAGFLAAMYCCLVGVKVFAAVAAGQGGKRLGGRRHVLALRLLAGVLVLLAVRSAWDGLGYLGFVS